MKLTIEKEKLVHSLKTVSKAMSSQSTIPMLSGVHINAASDGVIFETTDMDISIKHIEEALVEEQGATVVPGKFFGDIVNSLPKEPITLETQGEKLRIICGSINFDIAVLNALDFPQFPQIIPTRSLELPSEQLSEMVKRVGKAVSKDASRAILTGICFEVKDGFLRLAATDSYRLSISKEKVKRGENDSALEEIKTIIPGAVFDEVCKLSTEVEKIIIGETDNQIVFLFGSTTFISRKIEGNYPNFEQIVPLHKNVSVVVETDLLYVAVKRVSIVARNASAIKMSLHADTQQIEISTKSPDVGEAKEFIPAQIDGDEIEIGFNHQYILDGLSVVNEQEILFEAQSDSKPGIFKSIGSEDYFYLTMPVRLT